MEIKVATINAIIILYDLFLIADAKKEFVIIFWKILTP
jgi:hypothetical protein